MKIGIIVHSQTDNTYSVALKLQDALIQSGNEVEVKRVTMSGGDRPENKEKSGWKTLQKSMDMMH